MLDKPVAHGLLNTREAANVLGVRPRTLEHWRSIGAGPAYSKIGRAVRYSHMALDCFIIDNQHGTPFPRPNPFGKFANRW